MITSHIHLYEELDEVEREFTVKRILLAIRERNGRKFIIGILECEHCIRS